MRIHIQKTHNSERKTSSKNSRQATRPPAPPLIQLQRHLGNQTFQRLVQTKGIQPKLPIGNLHNIYEQEADRVAFAVMRMPDPDASAVDVSTSSNLALNIQHFCPECNESVKRQSVEPQENVELVQAKGMVAQTPEVNAELDNHIKGLSNKGQLLSSSVRNFMEPRFGQDLGHVRVHSDSQAAKMARTIDARAFTYGQNIVFGSSEYAPETTQGRHLIAHELTHVLQQVGTQSHTLMRKAACKCSTMGRDPTAREKRIAKRLYPYLLDGDWCVTGPATPAYNCISWTIGNTRRKIWSEVDSVYGNNDGTVSISDFDAFYTYHGLTPVTAKWCPSDPEVALFGKGSVPLHATVKSAHTCPGVEKMYESKRGNNIRIAHVLTQLEGGFYGNIIRYYIK